MKSIQILSLLALLFFLGCSPKEQNINTPIRITYPEWAEGEALTFLASCYLKEIGYNVVLKQDSIKDIYYSLYTGKQDVFLDAWLPDTHDFYYSKYKDQLDILSTVVDGVKLGLVVPSYVPINSIEELNNASLLFQNRIIGIEEDSGIVKQAREAIKAYNITGLKLCASTEKDMIAVLSFSIKKKEPVVITGWEYHWKFLRYDLKFLDDPKGIFSKSDKIQIVTRKNFAKERPEVAKILKNFSPTKEQLKSLLGVYRLMTTESQKKAAVAAWFKEHQDLIKTWNSTEE